MQIYLETMVPITLNRILCSPCSLVLWVSQQIKTKEIKKDDVRNLLSILSLILFLLFFLGWFIAPYLAMGIFSSVTKDSPRSVNQKVALDDSFLHLYYSGTTRTQMIRDSNGVQSMQKIEDKFSDNNFLHLKLRHLVALSYLSSGFYPVSNDKDKSGKSLQEERNPFSGTNFSFLLNELNVVIKVQNFYLRQWGCLEVESMQLPTPQYRTQHSMTGTVSHKGKTIALQTLIADVDELIAAKCGSSESDNSYLNIDRCFLLKNRRMLQQYLFLQELSHPNIAKLYGVCMPSNSKSSNGVIVAKEAGNPVDISTLKTLSWNERLKVGYDLVNLLMYFSSNPLGSILLENWLPANFIITPNNVVKLSNFDQEIKLLEPRCESGKECVIGGFALATKCVNGRCTGFNEKMNLYNLYKSFIGPVLENQIPSRISDDASKVFHSLKNLQCNSTVLYQLLKLLKVRADLTGSRRDATDSNADRGLGNKRLPDGMQVDSWEQHESHVAINEVDFAQEPVQDQNIQQNVGAEQSELRDLKETFGYKKIENADFPGRYDYYCPHSKAEWGCVVSLRKLEEAANKCDKDAKCKAFVTMPHLRKEGWIIVILKSDNTRAVDHAGTTVYIKASAEEGSRINQNEEEKAWPKDDSSVVKLCLQDLLHSQETLRDKREQQLMKACGWGAMSDSKWQSLILEATVKDATSFKPSRGKMAVGGQMNVVLDSSSKIYPSLFLAKKGPEEFHLAQLTTYHLDRMLGLFKTVPAFLRTLTAQEMKDAGFPVDVGGSQFDMFGQLKNVDKSLSGTIVPVVSDRIGVEHYISVPKLNKITNAVTPFSRRQWDDLEYLLLMWLASLPMPTKGHPSLQGHLVHIKTDEAFRSEPASVVLSYFNNCQFPKIAVDVLRNLRTAHCNFGDQLIARVRTAYPDILQTDFSFHVPVADIATRNANRLLEVVDACVRKFGDNVVLYDS